VSPSLSDGSVPTARRGATFVYDKASDQTILVGGAAGQSAGEVPGSTWMWNGTVWTRLHPVSAPPCDRFSAASAYDDFTGQVVLFGGQGPPQGPPQVGWNKADTWSWDGTSWILRSPATTPPERSWAAMAYLPTVKRLVMFGGMNDLGDTWLWDGHDWTEAASGDPAPPGRSNGTLAYDGHQLILFGGFRFKPGPNYLNDTWAFDGARWHQLLPASSPSARSSAGVLQQGPGGVVIVGGISETAQASTYYNDMWRWDGANWTKLSNAMPGPANRYFFMTAQDTLRGLGLLFGGKAGEQDLNDLWAWDGTTWRALP
jgi:hypothetical protein